MKNLFLGFLIFFNLSSSTFAQEHKLPPTGIPIQGKIMKIDNPDYHLRDLRKIRIGMSFRQVERKLGQKLKLEPERSGSKYQPLTAPGTPMDTHAD